MKKSIKTIGIIATMGIIAACSYYIGTTQTKTITESQTIEKYIEVVPSGYINTSSDEFYNNYIDMRTVINFEASENGLQLYTSDGNGYYWER